MIISSDAFEQIDEMGDIHTHVRIFVGKICELEMKRRNKLAFTEF